MKYDELGRLAFFNGFCPADLKLLAPYFTPQSFNANSVIFEQGGKADYLYLVVRGEVLIQYKPDDGPLMLVTRVQPGGVFGWSAAMGNPAYTSSASCSLDSRIVRIRGVDLRMLCDEYPQAGKVILERLAAVIAERKQSQQGRVTTMLANGIRQQSGNRGASKDGQNQN